MLKGGGKSGGGFFNFLGSIGSAIFGSFGGGSGFVPPVGASLSAGPFAHGGSFTVGGSPGIDNNVVAFRASRGERVTITPPGNATAGKATAGNATGETTIIVNNYGNDEVQVGTGQGLSGNQLVEIIIGAVRADMGRGGFDGVRCPERRRPSEGHYADHQLGGNGAAPRRCVGATFGTAPI